MTPILIRTTATCSWTGIDLAAERKHDSTKEQSLGTSAAIGNETDNLLMGMPDHL